MTELFGLFFYTRWQFFHTYLLIVRVTAKMSFAEIDFPQSCLTEDSHHIVFFYYMNHIFCPFYSLLYKSSYSSSIRRKMQNIADFRRFSSSLNNSWLKGNDWAITILQHVLTNLKSHYKNVIFRDRISSILPNTSQDAPNYFVYFFFTF